MSRMDELRAKLRNKPAFDEGYSEFISNINEFLVEKSAYVYRSQWTKDLYEKFNNDHHADMVSWLKIELHNSFLSSSGKPVWKFEPRWCFHDNIPLEFVGQIALGDKEIYIFSGRKVLQDQAGRPQGWKPIFKMLMQDDEGDIILDGLIET